MHALLRIAVVPLLLSGCLQTKTATSNAASDVVSSDAADVALAADVSEQALVAVTAPASWLTHPENTPKAIHTTWQHDPATTLTVQWTTAATELAGYTPKVWFGPEAEAGKDGATQQFGAARFATGTGEMYYQTIIDMNDLAPDAPHYITWTVELTGLTPDTPYVFRAGTWSDFKAGAFTAPDLSDVQHVRTGLAKGSRQKITAVLAGDSRNGADGIRANAQRLAAIDASLWVFNGDFNETGVQEQWDDWFDAMQPILSKHPLMPVQGNHEFFPPTYYGQFALPVEAGLAPEYKEHAWSLTIGNLHLIGLDSTQDSVVQDQSTWLEADLQAARADKDIDWIIAMMHHPAYSSCTNHGSTDRVQKYWVPLFEKYDVDLIFAGHDHDYERSWPWRANKKVDAGPVYVVAGGFYADGYTNGKDVWTATSSHGNKSNYVVLNVEGKSLSFTAFSGDGSETLDTYSLKK